MDILISNLLSESISDFGNGQTEITPITPIGIIGVFSVWPLPEVRNWLPNQILNENVHISILNFFVEHFDHHKKNVQNGFSIVFSKSDLGRRGQILWWNFFLKKPNWPEYAQVLMVMCPKLKFVAALLSPLINKKSLKQGQVDEQKL